MKTCRKVYRHICENLDQNLDSPQCREIKKHLESCPDCLAYLDSLKKTIRFYRAMPEPKLPEGTHLKLLTVIAREVTKHAGGSRTKHGISPGRP